MKKSIVDYLEKNNKKYGNKIIFSERDKSISYNDFVIESKSVATSILDLNFYNKPIIILNKGINILYDSFIMVPYKTISGNGLMKCIFCDKVYIKEIGYKYNVLIGLSNDKFYLCDADIILHKEMIK